MIQNVRNVPPEQNPKNPVHRNVHLVKYVPLANMVARFPAPRYAASVKIAWLDNIQTVQVRSNLKKNEI